MGKFCRFIMVVFFVSMISACSGGGSSDQAAKEAENPEPDKGVVSQFVIAPKEVEGAKYISISKDALSEEFLLQGEWSMQTGYGNYIRNPSFHSMKSRIVMFEDKGDAIFMMESPLLKKPGQELSANLIVASFPIKERTDSKIVFDFNQGMHDALLSFDWYSSDDYGAVITPDIGLKVEESFLREIKTFDKAISITQTMLTKYYEERLPLEFKYYLKKYEPNPNFVPVENQGFDYLGYFEAQPLVQEGFGDTYTFITKWDISKPITYYISTAFPEGYREAAREGVLYWNKVFGKEIFKAEIAPDGLTAPDFEHNIIQWMSEASGYAYADAQIDPRTGEILHAQIFVTTQYFDDWIAQIERKLGLESDYFTENKIEDEFLNKWSKSKNPNEGIIGSKRLGSDIVSIDRYENVFGGMAKYKATLTPERIKEVSQDLVRWLISHEVGHTMGLRHNFAASTINKRSSQAETDLLKRYLKGDNIDANVAPLINSVMEYPSFAAEVITGVLQNNPDAKPLPHDAYAIKWGYFGDGKKPKYEGLAFCTDSDVGFYEDCLTRDASGHLVDSRVSKAKGNLEGMARNFSEVYIYGKNAVNKKYRFEVKDQTPSGVYLAYQVAWPMLEFIRLLVRPFDITTIIKQYSGIAEIDLTTIDNETMNWLSNDIEFAGGIEKAMGLIDPEYFSKTFAALPDKLKEITASDAFRKASFPEGGTVNFTDEEIAYINERGAAIFPVAKDRLANMLCWIMMLGEYQQIAGVEKLEAVIAKFAGHIVTSGEGLAFEYSYNTRQMAAMLLVRNNGPFPDWMVAYVPPIAETLKAHLEAGLGMPLDKLDIESVPREDREKIEQEINIYWMLAKVGAKPMPMPVLVAK